MKIQPRYKTLTVMTGLMLAGAVIGGLSMQTGHFSAERSEVPPLPSAPTEQLVTDQELDTLRNDIVYLKQDTRIDTLKREIAHLKQDKQKMQQVSTHLAQELAQLRLQVEQAAETFSNSSVRATPSEKAEEVPEEPETIPADAEQYRQDQSEAQVTLLEDTILTEEPDPQWAKTAKQSLYDAFDEVEPNGFVFQSADCKTTMCRLSLYLDQDVDASEAFRRMSTTMPWEGAGFARISDETGEVEIYLAREGHQLPQVTP